MKSNEQTKYYVYLRKSSESEEKQVQSIERQEDEVQKIVEVFNLQVVGTFQESRSAKLPDNRPEFSKMLTGIRKGYAQGIICWHINRLSRNPLESGIIQQLLEDGKIKRIVTKDRMYTAEDNAIIYSVETSLATQYSKDLGKMVKSGLEKKVALGICPTLAPIGYLNTGYKEHGTNKIVKDEKLFPIIRKVWDMVLTKNYTVPEVLKVVINEVGLKKTRTRKGNSFYVTRSGLYKILSNPFYTGYFKYNGELHKGIHTPMITMTEFDMVQEIIGRKLKPRSDKKDFAFTGMFQCANCGSAITATEKRKWVKSLNQYKKYTYYYCSRKKKGATNCPINRPITKDNLQDIIKADLEKFSIDIDFKNHALKALKLILESNFDISMNTTTYQENEVTKLEKELKNLLQLRLNESISDEEYKLEKMERESKLENFKAQISRSRFTAKDIEKQLEEKMNSIVNLSIKFTEESSLGKKSILNMVGSNYLLNNKNLIYNKEKWLNHIGINKKGIQSEIEWLELDKTLITYDYLCEIGTMCPLLSSLVNYIRTNSKD